MSTIVTLRLDVESQAWFDGLRERFYPVERNRIAAHVTLFHTLPGDVRWELEAASEATGRFPVRVTGVRSLGKGVAYTLAGAEMMEVHRRLAEAFREHLTAQDRQRWMPHVVVQNKVSVGEARELLGRLAGEFEERSCVGVGLDLWEYLGGPWGHLETFWFG